MMIAEGRKACARVRDIAPNARKSIDKARVVTKDMTMKVKNADVVRRRFVIK
jgi:hypothetical protein